MSYINLPPALQQLFQKIDDRLTRLELAVRFTAPNVTSDPSNPRNGDLFVNTTTTLLKIIIAGLTRTIAFLETAQTWVSMQTFQAGATYTVSGATVATIGTDANGTIELGNVSGAATTPYIDFHAGATAVDYDARIVASGGTGTIGQGTLEIIGGTTKLTTTNVNLQSVATATTVGAAGGASALPATPLGYITIQIAGTNRKIPYYNV